MRLYFKIGYHFLHTIERCRPEEGERLVAVFRKRPEAEGGTKEGARQQS
jgi:hypothetical protein